MKENEFKKHLVIDQDTGVSGFFDTKQDDTGHRKSKLLPFTAVAMAKIQEKLGVTVESVSPLLATIKAFKMLGVELEEIDFNRKLGAGVVEAKADKTVESSVDKIVEKYKVSDLVGFKNAIGQIELKFRKANNKSVDLSDATVLAEIKASTKPFVDCYQLKYGMPNLADFI